MLLKRSWHRRANVSSPSTRRLVTSMIVAFNVVNCPELVKKACNTITCFVVERFYKFYVDVPLFPE
jgi:hypothetical protein